MKKKLDECTQPSDEDSSDDDRDEPEHVEVQLPDYCAANVV